MIGLFDKVPPFMVNIMSSLVVSLVDPRLIIFNFVSNSSLEVQHHKLFRVILVTHT
jgi:hypothetical protein